MHKLIRGWPTYPLPLGFLIESQGPSLRSLLSLQMLSSPRPCVRWGVPIASQSCLISLHQCGKLCQANVVNSVKSQPTLLVILSYIMHDFSLDLISSMSCHSKFDTLHLNKYEKYHFPVFLTEVTLNICIRSRQPIYSIC